MPMNDYRMDIKVRVEGQELLGSHPECDIMSFLWREELGKIPIGELELCFGAGEPSKAPTLDAWAGKSISIAIVAAAESGARGQSTYFDGIVTSTRIKAAKMEISYVVEIRPKVWSSAQVSDCKIWFSDDAKDGGDPISNTDNIKAVLSDLGLDVTCAYTSRLKTSFTAQFRETTYNYLMRLLENDGAYLVYDHSVDPVKASIVEPTTSNAPSLTLRDSEVDAWDISFAPRPASAKVFGFDFLQSSVEVSGEHVASSAADLEKFSGHKHHIVEYPGNITTHDEAAGAARAIAESVHSEAAVFEATVNTPRVQPGQCVKLEGAFGQGDKDQLGEVFVTAAELSYSGEGGLQVWFRGVSAARPYRPARVTPRPKIHGVQTALVTNSDADCDELGRVRVKFHWPSAGAGDAGGPESPWLRVAQAWASEEVGVFTLPNVGDEVLVAFEHGDPDRPVIIGSLWNSKHKPPVSLPDDWTQTRIKTRRGHQLTFEDKDGGEYIELISGQKENMIKLDDNEEKILVHATKDYKTTVDNDYVLEATNKIELTVGQSSITIDTSGITIKSASGDITIEGLNVKASAKVAAELKGSASAKLEASGQTTVKGAMVMIN